MNQEYPVNETQKKFPFLSHIKSEEGPWDQQTALLREVIQGCWYLASCGFTFVPHDFPGCQAHLNEAWRPRAWRVTHWRGYEPGLEVMFITSVRILLLRATYLTAWLHLTDRYNLAYGRFFQVGVHGHQKIMIQCRIFTFHLFTCFLLPQLGNRITVRRLIIQQPSVNHRQMWLWAGFPSLGSLVLIR